MTSTTRLFLASLLILVSACSQEPEKPVAITDHAWQIDSDASRRAGDVLARFRAVDPTCCHRPSAEHRRCPVRICSVAT